VALDGDNQRTCCERVPHLRHNGILAPRMTTDVPSYELTVETGDDRVTFIPRGELDLATAPELEQQVLAAVRDGSQTVVLDLRELTFMDSTGVRTIVAAHQVAEESDNSLIVVRPARESAVSRVIEISGIDEALGLVDAP
jgi:anti-sigma B factor antagonist